MKDPTAAVRLRQTQNADGGWGYFPGKQSWLEPTFYAAVALAGEAGADRAWALLKTWQNADGSVTLPAALRPYMKNRERLERRVATPAGQPG